ncbi:hypothetical protein [Streptosporangium roseum]
MSVEVADAPVNFGIHRAAARRTASVPHQRYLHARAARLATDDR